MEYDDDVHMRRKENKKNKTYTGARNSKGIHSSPIQSDSRPSSRAPKIKPYLFGDESYEESLESLPAQASLRTSRFAPVSFGFHSSLSPRTA